MKVQFEGEINLKMPKNNAAMGTNIYGTHFLPLPSMSVNSHNGQKYCQWTKFF